MKKIYYLFVLIVLFIACNSQEDNQLKKKEPEYPHIIDSLGLQKYYDDTKWTLYLLVADKEPSYSDCSHITLFDTFVYYSSLDLKFDSIYINDTGKLMLYFQFFLNDSTPINNWKFRASVNYTTGMEYDLKDSLNATQKITIRYLYKDEAISSIGHLDMDKAYIDTTSEREINPLQPYVIEFLNNNKKTLHPWLYKEAVKRGVIKE